MNHTIFFDLDGTLTDSAPGIIHSVQYALKKYGIEAEENDLRSFIGPPLVHSFQERFGFDHDKALEAVAYYREYFTAGGMFENSVYPGVEEMLQKLKEDGLMLAVATSKPELFSKIVLVKEDGLLPLENQDSIEKVKSVRQEAKKRVFVTNAIRALTMVSPTGNPRDIQFVVMVGGSALDFEIPNMVTDVLAEYDIVAGRGNIRGTEGPRNAVATGLALSCLKPVKN